MNNQNKLEQLKELFISKLEQLNFNELTELLNTTKESDIRGFILDTMEKKDLDKFLEYVENN